MTEVANINIDDAVLVKQCRGGDVDAMERLILKYQNRVYNIILKMCANTDDAAELTQDTFVKVIENIDKFEGRSSFYTWLFRIAVNATLNHCKRNIKIRFESLDTENDNGQNQMGRIGLKKFLSNGSSPDPAIVAQNRELHQIVIKSLMKLKDDQRTVLILRDIEGMNYDYIAKVLDVELGTVKSRLSRARNNLREILEAILE